MYSFYPRVPILPPQILLFNFKIVYLINFSTDFSNLGLTSKISKSKLGIFYSIQNRKTKLNKINQKFCSNKKAFDLLLIKQRYFFGTHGIICDQQLSNCLQKCSSSFIIFSDKIVWPVYPLIWLMAFSWSA